MSENKSPESLENPELKLGGILNRSRKSKNFSVEEISDHTKLSTHIISSLENNKFEDIGASVYVRGYINIYAKFLQLDVNEMLELYSEETPLRDTEIKPHVANGSHIFSLKKKKKRSVVVVGFFVFLFLLLASFIYMDFIEPMAKKIITERTTGENATANNVAHNDANNIPKAGKSTNSKSLQVQLPLVEETKKVIDNADKVLNNEPAQTSSTNTNIATNLPITPTNSSNSSQNATPNASLSNANSSNTSSVTDTNAVTFNNHVNSDAKVVAEQATTDNHPTTSVITKKTIVITASDRNWVEIKDKNKKIIYSNVMKKGEIFSIKIENSPISIRTANINKIYAKFDNGEKAELNKYKQTKNTYVIANY